MLGGSPCARRLGEAMVGGGPRIPRPRPWWMRRRPRNRRERVIYTIVQLHPKLGGYRRRLFDVVIEAIVFCIFFLFVLGLFVTDQGARVRNDLAKLFGSRSAPPSSAISPK
jgi:hypothetical protein